MRRVIGMNRETIHIKDDALSPTLGSEVAQERVELLLVHRLRVELIVDDLLVPSDAPKEGCCLHIQLVR